jgi:hypothetical protein
VIGTTAGELARVRDSTYFAGLGSCRKVRFVEWKMLKAASSRAEAIGDGDLARIVERDCLPESRDWLEEAF